EEHRGHAFILQRRGDLPVARAQPAASAAVGEHHHAARSLGRRERARQSWCAGRLDHELPFLGHARNVAATGHGYPPAVRLFDRRTGQLEDIEVRSSMGVYVCGITPYDSSHLGHAFTYVHFDVLVRYLRHFRAGVTHVQNVTDVDDDILRVARERSIDFRELAARETESFERHM